MKQLASLVAIGVALLPLAASAAPAVRLGISSSFCFIQTCPGVQPPAPTTVASGAAFGVFIAALDGSSVRDTNYTGTVSFSSSDPLMTVMGAQSPESIPALSVEALVLLAAMLGAAGILFLRLRS